MTDKKKPTFDLETLKGLIEDTETRLITEMAQENASELGFYTDDIVECVRSLLRADFHKSMTTIKDHKLWQDVYKPTYKEIQIYLKLQIGPEGECVVISFKRDEGD